MTETPLLLTREGPVARLTLNRPERRNAMNSAMGEAIDAALDELATDTTTRVVILSGAGGHFCAGLDLTQVGSVGNTEAERAAAAQARNHATGQRFIRRCRGRRMPAASAGFVPPTSPSPPPMRASAPLRSAVAWCRRRSCPGWSAAWAARRRCA